MYSFQLQVAALKRCIRDQLKDVDYQVFMTKMFKVVLYTRIE